MLRAAQSIIPSTELLLSEKNAISPVVITEPSPLVNPGAVKQMRAEIFHKEIVK